MKFVIKRSCLTAALLCSLAFSLTTLAAGEEVSQAEALLKQGKAAEAYALLSPLDFELSGDIHYDYLLGVAALDSGKPAEATLAFERVLAVNPNFGGARLDLARAYFAMGNLTQAKTEFEAVLTQNPPDAARATVNQHLAAIEARGKTKQGGTTAYLEISGGHDTNVNNSANQGQVYIPLFGATFTLSPTSVKLPDDYITLGGGVETVHPIAPQWSMYAGADLKGRNNFDEKQFNSLSLDTRAGLSFEDGPDTVRGGVLWGRYLLAGKPNRNLSGFNAEWRRLLDPSNQVSLFGQYSRIRYPDGTLITNEVNQTLAGAGWLHAIEHPLHPILFASVYDGIEKEIIVSTDGNKRITGLRIGSQLSLQEDIDLFASISAQDSRYDRESLAFQTYRRDKQYDFNLGLAWRADKDWSIKPVLAYTHNDSNQGIYEYDRVDFSVTLRRSFN